MRSTILAILGILILFSGQLAFAEEVTTDELLKRIEVLEQQTGNNAWLRSIILSGTIEVEEYYSITDFDAAGEDDLEEADMTLATVELGADIEIMKMLSGYLLFLWEEDDTESVIVDEGYIYIGYTDIFPLYLKIGKMYVPFGNFESHMVSDPLTVEIGETCETAFQIGFTMNWFDINFASFYGDIDETNEDEPQDTYIGSCTLTLPEGKIEGVAMSGGVSYITNIGDTDGLSGEIMTDGSTIDDYVDGIGAFFSSSFKDRIFLEAEYIGALDKFQAGEIFDTADTKKRQPWAMDVEVAVGFSFSNEFLNALEIALSYQQAEDVLSLPETVFGGAATLVLIDNFSISLEYVHGEYENNDKVDTMTSQFAFSF